MQCAMAEFGIFGPGESGRVRFAELCKWAAGHPAIAPKGHVNYHDPEYRDTINQLQQNIAKKACKSRQTMWELIADARADFAAANHGVPIQPIGSLPDLGVLTVDSPYMPPNQGSNKARMECAAQHQTIATQAAAAAAGPPASPPLAVPPPPPAIPAPSPLAAPAPLPLAALVPLPLAALALPSLAAPAPSPAIPAPPPPIPAPLPAVLAPPPLAAPPPPPPPILAPLPTVPPPRHHHLLPSQRRFLLYWHPYLLLPRRSHLLLYQCSRQG